MTRLNKDGKPMTREESLALDKEMEKQFQKEREKVKAPKEKKGKSK